MIRDRRDKILLKAFELFTLHGYDGVSITDLQVALDMGRATMYYYFKDKDDLFRTVIRRYFFSPHQGSMMGLGADLSIRDMIDNRTQFIFSLKEPLAEFENKNVNTARVVGLMTTAYSHFPDLYRKANSLYRLEYDLWCRAIRNDIKRGVIRDDTPIETLARMLCNTKYAYDAGNANRTMDFDAVRSDYEYIYSLIRL